MSWVPGIRFSFCTPGGVGSSIPMSTGSTVQFAVFAIKFTVLSPRPNAAATAVVTDASDWLTPWATTPLSLQNTSSVRRESRRFPLSAAIFVTFFSSTPRLPRGLARVSQC